MKTKHKNNWLIFNHTSICQLCLQRTFSAELICQPCKQDLPWLKNACRQCALPIKAVPGTDLLCPQCIRKPPPFHSVKAAFEYRFPIDQLILRAKFNQQTAYLRLLARLLVQRVIDEPRPDLLIPVPLHRNRLLQRQYNQSAILSGYIGEILKLPVDYKLLKKKTDTAHQAELERKQRKRNLSNSFQCCAQPPASVAIIDDVVTTAATATELSRILINAGCRTVDIWAIARTGKGGDYL